jgi:hypothetical protein
MEITVAGIIFLPLGIYGFIARPGWLLPLLIVSSIFQGAAVVNISTGADYGLSPYYFFAILVAVRVWLGTLVGFSGVLMRRRWVPLMLFVLVAVFGAVVLPNIFQGIAVFNPREGIDAQQGSLSRLVFSAANLTHSSYLLLNVSVLVAFYRAALKPLVKGVEGAIHIAAATACVIGIYQFMHMNYGFPFPFKELYSNIQIRKDMVGSLAGYQRVFSSFPEPSYFSAFLVAYIFFYCSRCARTMLKSPLRLVYLVTMLLLLILTGSATGYVALIFTAVLWFAFSGGVAVKAMLWKAAVAAFMIGLAGWLIAVSPMLSSLMQAAIFEKNTSLSAVNRVAADLRGLSLAQDTLGLGVGLGSNATSSFVVMLLSNCGIVGLSLFGVAVGLDVRRFRVAESALFKRDKRGVGLWAFVAVVTAMAIAIPYLNWPILWVFWGIVLYVSSSERQRNMLVASRSVTVNSSRGTILNGV